MSLKQFWLKSCQNLSMQEADFYSGARKILRRRELIYKMDKGFGDLTMADCGFTKSKTSMLMRNYYLEESVDVAKVLWKGRLEKEKYGSVGFSTYAHFVKGGLDAKRSKRASVMGPCIQGVTLTLLKKGETSIDVFYRTTELFKKFPADLVFLRDNLLNGFDFRDAPIRDIAFHFANVTCHPMYAITFLPHLEDPVAWLERLRKHDKFFHDWQLKWSARYICEEHSRGIQKFSQALRVRDGAMSALDKNQLRDLQKYFRKNHPGHRNAYEDEGEEE